ncbi:hypothetical protein AB4876_05185 [Zhongshania guokunii]|uniref:Uncharacterized protein n=1 Tax=Zhongshania guokunii TaxID=641783 RepID=A0ABV3U315_9GAMM
MIFNNRTIEKQRAQSPPWVSLIIAAFVAIFTVGLFSFTHDHILLWFVGLFGAAYILARGTMGIRSWIREDGDGKYMLCLRDNVSRANAYIPFEYISNTELCDYAIWPQDNTPPAYRDLPYHRTYTQFGYRGAGLLVCYTSPPHLGGDGLLRSWLIPAPRAAEFLELLNDKHGPNHK